MSLNVALYNAVSGLMLNQRSMDVTAHNVANVNTEGYSRKIVNQESMVLDGFGAGVRLTDISRNVDQYLLRDVRETLSQTGEARVVNHFFDRMQELFGAPGADSSIGNLIGEFETTVQALANTPESLTARIELVGRAQLLAQQFRDIAGDIQSLRLEADKLIEQSVETVNTQLALIEELNVKIAQNLALGREVADLQDRRDLAMSAIAEEMDINHFVRDNGEVVIFTASGRTLLDRTAKTLSHDAASTFAPEIVWNAAGTGAVDGIMLDGVDITAEFRTGRIAGLIEMRDAALPDLNSQFGELAYSIVDELNAIHNQGTAFPAPSTMTGTRGVSAGDTPPWTGNARIAVVDNSGTVVEVQDFDLSTYATVGDLVTALDGLANLSATFNADGQVVLAAAGGNGVSINGLDSSVTVGNRNDSLASFLGLNDLFTSASNNYDNYLSSQQADGATPLSLTGTLTFSGAFGSASIAYGPGDDLATIAANITADGTLAGAGISASLVSDGSGVRLRITDAGGDNFFVTDTSNFLSTLNVRVDAGKTNSSIAVRSDIVNDPSLIVRGELSGAAGLAAGDVGATAGDRTVVQRLADKFTERLNFDRIGQMGSGSRTLSDFGAAIVGLNASQAATASDTLDVGEFLLTNLQTKAASISGVNLDEEMANLIILENAYAAAARVISTTTRLFDLLEELVG